MILTILLWTSGCGIPPVPIDLIKPPSLQKNTELNQHSTTIISLLPDGSRVLIPERGIADSGVLFSDVDGDGIDEAVVVYEESIFHERILKAALLKQLDEEWRIIWNAEGFGYGIDYMGVTDVNSDGIQDLLLGWSFGAGGNGMDIYGWINDTLQLLDTKEYDDEWK